MILTLTLNPAIDKSAIVDTLKPGKKMRCRGIIREAGGGGINVSKALKELGWNSSALFPAGGDNGQLLTTILEGSGITYIAIKTTSETREDFTVMEESSQKQYRFIMPGASLDKMELQYCLDAVLVTKPMPNIVVASGSLPPGVPEDFLALLAGMLKAKGIKFVVDTSGRPLQLAAQAGVYLLKPNLSELSSMADREILTDVDIAVAAQDLIKQKYSEIIVVSMGEKGAMVVTPEINTVIRAPEVKVKSTVGAGDSMVAGMVWMIEKGGTPLEMACFGVACGTAATMNAGTQLFKKEDALMIYKQLHSKMFHR